jgi:ubiquinone/menaquinone biosynthesis C-methylase UbiE
MPVSILILLVILILAPSSFSAWTAKSTANQPTGQKIEILKDDKPVARFVYGEGQLKPFLHLYGAHGELLTDWSPQQQFPHHRGIFIGWNRIESEIGRSDLWHLNHGEKMITKDVRTQTDNDGVSITAKIEWHAQKGDDIGDTILINETRRLRLTQPAPGKTQVDAHFTIAAVRDLTLDGDLQHAGIHFRAAHEVTNRKKETRYVWEPDLPGPGGKVVSPDLKWCRLIFPIGTNWYAATELNSPSNPTAELSWRDYGRFGFFFKHKLEWGDALDVKYRFITEPTTAPDDLAAHRLAAAAQYQAFAPPRYQQRSQHDPNGIGKFYMGREIAHVMGHQGADWLERPERVDEEKPDKMIELLGLQPGQSVADIGAGTGYISWRMADKVGTAGKVYAVDIQQEMLDLLSKKMKTRGLENVVPILGTITSVNLPANSIDLAIMVDVYHEFSHPHEMMQSIVAALKSGGRLAFVEYRAEDPEVPIKRVHKMSEAQVKKESAASGLVWEKTIPDLPRQHLIIMRKP